ncbi:NrdH-redoxin [Glutamicibacter sp. FR1]|uniref:NrdH-redoxin n=1 Tax=Glutamicibacter sp. FR1 TaxID=3393744 RepID=UPI0039AEA6C5
MNRLVTLYTKPAASEQCADTVRALNAAGIPFQEIVVNPSDQQSNDELSRIAKQLGEPETMPYVLVLDRDTEDIHGWFGFQPDRIQTLVEESPAVESSVG